MDDDTSVSLYSKPEPAQVTLVSLEDLVVHTGLPGALPSGGQVFPKALKKRVGGGLNPCGKPAGQGWQSHGGRFSQRDLGGLEAWSGWPGERGPNQPRPAAKVGRRGLTWGPKGSAPGQTPPVS